MPRKAAVRNGYDPEELKVYMALSAKKKLRFLEEMRTFFSKTMSSKSKKAWDELRSKGW